MRFILTVILAAMPAVASAQTAAPQSKPAPAAQGAPAPAKPAGPASEKAAPPQGAPAQAASPFKDPKERVSYALGMDLGNQLKTNGVEVDPAVLARGLQDSLMGATTVITPDEARAIITELQKGLVVKQAAEAKVQGEKSKAEGEAFLAANKTKEGVVALPSGVQYKVMTAGTGKKPQATDQVVCHYRGTTIDGREFDSSYKRNEPSTFPVQKVIKGWTEVLQLMPVGSKWQVFIPSDLAYGERGAPGAGIAPNSVLIFEIELMGIK
jgi:FKBP-type peptidyl-prolyl cis-trans isomerase FklB